MNKLLLLLLRGRIPRDGSPVLRMSDELGEPFASCLFPLRGDNPISAHPLIPRSLRAEEFPSGFVGAKLLGLFTSELGVLALFV